MKTECIGELIDIILDPAELSIKQMKLELRERGIDAERWQRKVLCRLEQIKEQVQPVQKGELRGKKSRQYREEGRSKKKKVKRKK